MTFDDTAGVEDSLQSAAVFINPISGRTCHSDSYMTVVDFSRLDAWLAACEYTPEQLRECATYWTTNENMQPPLRLVGLTILRRIAA